MSQAPAVLLLDDGELVRVRALLEELGAQVDHLRGEAVREDIEHPYDVVVTTATRAMALGASIDAAAIPGKPVWIAVHHQDFLPLRDKLRGLGVHYLVHLTVDSAVLRLLLLHALYRGPEKRDAQRLLAGSTVSCRVPGGRWPATLVDLTLDGCRLLASHTVEWGSSVAVALPAGLAGDTEVVLQGRVVRSEPDPDSSDRQKYLIAVTFDTPHPSWVQLWDTVLRGRAIGTRVTRLADVEARNEEDERSANQGRTSKPRAKEPSERRRAPRASYPQSVLAIAEEATHVILGRDLSVGGMRVEPQPHLWVGSRLLLSIYGAPDEEPVVVTAWVDRDDGENGLLLRFNHGTPEARERLAQIIASLDAVEALAGGDSEGPRVLASSRPAEDDSGS